MPTTYLPQTVKLDHTNSRIGETTRERILAAAHQLFSAKGVSGVPTREIARAAQVSEVTLFRYFPTKDQLLEAVIDHFSLPSIKDLIPPQGYLPYDEGLARLADQLLVTLDSIRDWIRILHGELLRSPGELYRIYHSFLDNLFEVLASYFRELQGRGGLRDVDPEMAARVFHGIFYCFFTVEELLEGKRIRTIDRERAIRSFVDIFANGTVSGPSAAVAGER